jgi:uncharacterized protein (TIGR03118 family)
MVPSLELLEDRTVPSGYQQINLVGIQPGMAHFTDPNLNGWGMTSMPNGSFVVANTFSTGLATFYDRSGHVLPQTIKIPVEAAESQYLKDNVNAKISTIYGHPTGVVYNPTNDFCITNPDTGVRAPATLIFDTLDGTLCGWNPAVDPTEAIPIPGWDTWVAGHPAVFTGLEIGQEIGHDGHEHNVLYAADFLNNQLEVINGSFTTIKTITFVYSNGKTLSQFSDDPNSSVWSVQAVGNKLYVTLANLFGPTPGGGAVDVFNADGNFQYQLDANGPGAGGRLQNPWGITQAPANFGAYSNDLLVGNVLGNVAGAGGRINVYDPNTHHYLGQLDQPDGTPIAIKGLWDLEFGDGTPDSGKTNQLFFDAGPNHPGDSSGGLFGVIRAAGDQGGGGAGQGGDIMSASIKSSTHGHGGGSGGSGGSFYPTASNVSQLIADINYADTVGGTFTINLKPGTTFELQSAIGNTVNGLPVIGGTKAVNLTILGNGDTIERNVASNNWRLFEVAVGASLTLDQLTLQNGYAFGFDGGAIYNQGTLMVSNSTLSDNVSIFTSYAGGGYGGAIYNAGGTVTVSNSTLSGNSATFDGGGIYNDAGTLTVSNGSTLFGNSASYGGGIYNDFAGTLTVSGCTISGYTASQAGGGIYNGNAGTATVEISSSITGNTAPAGYGADVYNLGVLYLDSTSTIGTLDGNPPL